MSNAARSTQKQVVRATAEVARAARKQRHTPQAADAAAPATAAANAADVLRPPASARDNTQASVAAAIPEPTDRLAVAVHEGARMIPAGPWTIRDVPVTDDLLELVQSKDSELVRRMNELPEIKTSAPKETLGSRTISRTLPRDRTSHPRFKTSAPPQDNGTLNTGQVTQMLATFAKTPHNTAAVR